MEQRPLRLGDIVDDYCPRERRITNHTIVAVVGDVIRQTRCATCEAEHVYKDGREPRRRRRDDLADDRVGLDAPNSGPGQLRRPDPPASGESPSANGAPMAAQGDRAPAGSGNAEDGGDASVPAEESATEGAWTGHRRLIRATLPRTEGELPPPRPIPEFTMHQRPQSRGGRPFRFGQSGGSWQGGNGSGQPGGFRHGRPSHGGGNANGNGQGDVNGNGPGHGQGGGGRPGRHRGRHKRSR